MAQKKNNEREFTIDLSDDDDDDIALIWDMTKKLADHNLSQYT